MREARAFISATSGGTGSFTSTSAEEKVSLLVRDSRFSFSPWSTRLNTREIENTGTESNMRWRVPWTPKAARRAHQHFVLAHANDEVPAVQAQVLSTECLEEHGHLPTLPHDREHSVRGRRFSSFVVVTFVRNDNIVSPMALVVRYQRDQQAARRKSGEPPDGRLAGEKHRLSSWSGASRTSQSM